MAAEPIPHIETFVLGDYMTNCFVVTVPESGAKECWIVDCGFDPDPLLDFVEAEGLTPVGLLLTHCHADHMAGVDAALARFGAMPLYVHEDETGFCSDPMKNLSALLGAGVTCTEPDRVLHDGDELEFLGTTWRVIHTPGHSPGGVCFVHYPSGQALVGDTLFQGSIGRIDFPTSNPEDMRRTIQQTMMGLPDELVIHPGHGPSTTIGAERAGNPFVVQGF